MKIYKGNYDEYINIHLYKLGHFNWHYIIPRVISDGTNGYLEIRWLIWNIMLYEE